LQVRFVAAVDTPEPAARSLVAELETVATAQPPQRNNAGSLPLTWRERAKKYRPFITPAPTAVGRPLL